MEPYDKLVGDLEIRDYKGYWIRVHERWEPVSLSGAKSLGYWVEWQNTTTHEKDFDPTLRHERASAQEAAKRAIDKVMG